MATKGSWLYQMMANPLVGEQATEADVGIEPASYEDDDYTRLRIKKKKQTALLRRMLDDGGYGDLSKMVNIRGGSSSGSDFDHE